MNPLRKLFQFFTNLLTPKTVKTPKVTKNLTTLKPTNLIKTESSIRTSHDKISDKAENLTRIWKKQTNKQVSKTSATGTSEIIKAQYSKKDKHWTYSNGEKPTSRLKPGIIFDSCCIVWYEDYLQELKKYGSGILSKLHSNRVYVLTKSGEEFYGKKCPKNEDEVVRKKGAQFTGKPREFMKTVTWMQKSFGVKIYVVEIKNSPEINSISEEFIIKFHDSGLHHPDSLFAAFAYITKSILVTLDDDLIYSSKRAKVKFRDFRKFLDRIMGESPMTRILRKRSLSPKKDTAVVLMYGNHDSFNSRRKR